jgi:Cu-Zn family superoxide dismutase
MVDVSHGMRSDSILERHVGDLGNIEIDADGSANLNILDWVITLGSNKTTSVINLPLMIHNLTDDGGHTGRGESNTTG